jgi:hypothetical protein
MDFLQRLFLEDVWRLAVLAVLVIGATAIAWYHRPERCKWWIPVLAVVVMAGLFVVQRVVVTDREQIRGILFELVVACETEDVDRIIATIDEGYNADGLTYDVLVPLIRQGFEVVDVSEIRLLGLHIEPTGDEAVAKFAAIHRVDWGAGEQPYRSRWELHWYHREAGWKIDWIRPIPEEGQPAASLEELVP